MRPVTTLAALGVLVLTLGACASADTAADSSDDTAADSSADAAAATDAPSDGAAASAPISVVIGATDAVDLLTERDDVVIIDVRTPAEFADGHLVDAELIDIQDPSFRANVEALDRETAYVVYCRTGNRSAAAVTIMQELGFVELYDAGGFVDLAGAGAAVMG